MLSCVSAYNGGTLHSKIQENSGDALSLGHQSQVSFFEGNTVGSPAILASAKRKSLNFFGKRCCDPVTTED